MKYKTKFYKLHKMKRTFLEDKQEALQPLKENAETEKSVENISLTDVPYIDITKEVPEHEVHEQIEVKKTDETENMHVLSYTWTWYINSKTHDTDNSWDTSMKKTGTFGTVEHAWGVFDNLWYPNEMLVGYDYMIFKEDIKPEWEDEKNLNGGRWSLCVFKNKEYKNTTTNSIWENIFITIMSNKNERFCEDLCGITLGKKKNYDRVSIWLSCNNREEIMKHGKYIMSVLEIPESLRLNFQYHKEMAGGNMKSSFVI